MEQYILNIKLKLYIYNFIYNKVEHVSVTKILIYSRKSNLSDFLLFGRELPTTIQFYNLY